MLKCLDVQLEISIINPNKILIFTKLMYAKGRNRPTFTPKDLRKIYSSLDIGKLLNFFRHTL